MCEMSVEEELYDKMFHELRTFRASMVKLEPTAIIYDYKAYELVYKEDILMCFEDGALHLHDDDIEFLLSMDAPLDWLYQSWCESGVSHMDMLQEFIKNTVEMRKVHND